MRKKSWRKAPVIIRGFNRRGKLCLASPKLLRIDHSVAV